jgi:hypothetical protein
MAQKQGGKGKASSQSDKNYWARVKARGGVSTHKEANQKAQKKNPVRAAGDYPRKPIERKPAERVVFSGPVKDQRGIPLHRVTCNGVILELSPKHSDAITAVSDIIPRLDYAHVVVNPLTGKISPVSSRAFGR